MNCTIFCEHSHSTSNADKRRYYCRSVIISPSFQSLTEDVDRQTEREKELQARYDKLNFELQNLQVDAAQAAKVSAEGDGDSREVTPAET